MVLIIYFLLISVLLFVQSTLGKIQLSTPDSIHENETIAINWTRDDNEPNAFFWSLRVKYNDTNDNFIEVPVERSDGPNGIVNVPFSSFGLVTLEQHDLEKGEQNFLKNITVLPSEDEDIHTEYPYLPNFTVTSNSGSSVPSLHSHPSASKTPVIVGSVIGSLVFLLLVAIILLLLRKRHKRHTVIFDREKMIRYHKTASTTPFFAFEREAPPDDDGGNSSENKFNSLKSTPSETKILNTLPMLSKVFGAHRDRIDTHLAPTENVFDGDTRNRKMHLVRICPSMPSPTSSLYCSTSRSSTNSSHKVIITHLTDRQLEVQGVIHQLQAKMIRIQSAGNDPDNDKCTVEEIEEEVMITRLKAEVDKLKNIRESQWALGVSDDVPSDWEVLRNCHDY